MDSQNADGGSTCVESPETGTPPSTDLMHELQALRAELESREKVLREMRADAEASRNRYRDLYESTPIAYLSLTEDGAIAAINPAGAALLGEEREELLQAPFARFVAAEEQGRWQTYLLDAWRGHERRRLDLSLRRRDGTAVDVRVETLGADAIGSVPTLCLPLIVITRYEQILAQLKTCEERLRIVRNSAKLGVNDHNLITGIAACDERMRHIWGFGPDEPASYEDFLAGVHPDDQAAMQAAIGRSLNSPSSGDYDIEYRVINRTDHQVHHVAAIGKIFFDRGRAIRSCGIIRDITAQKKLEEELQERRREMEQLHGQQVAMHTASAIAHELNQPLISISNYCEAAARMVRGNNWSPEKLSHALRGAVKQSLRAGQTLHDLLDFLHQGDVSFEPVDLNALVREVITIGEHGGYGDFQPVVELEHDLPPVLANRLQIQKVLLNLLQNGVVAMRDAGVPDAAIVIRVRSMACKSMAQLTIQDSGPGLDTETAERIFEPFFTTKASGVGLGLAISRAIVEAHGGQLWAELESGPGATFHFTLPFAK